MGCDQKSIKVVWWCHQPLSGFLAKSHLPRVSRQSSVANDKGDKLDYRMDVCRVTRTHIEHLEKLRKLFDFPCNSEQFSLM